MIDGVIVKSLSGFYDVDCHGERLTCRGRGKLRYQGCKPLVGDRVRVDAPDGPSKLGAVVEILPRKNQFQRPAVANLDALVLICSGAPPITDPFLIDRMSVLASLQHCQCILCFNKWDLAQPCDLYTIYTRAGFPTFQVSAVTGLGIQDLNVALKNKTCAFTGNSGVGKSSILNALDSRFTRAVGEVSQKLGRGRHTTRHVELFRLPNGALIADTPGFSSFDCFPCPSGDSMPFSSLADSFPDFSPFLGGKCRFPDCAHRCEPGCQIIAAVQRGDIARSRYESYLRLCEESPWSCRPTPR